MRGQVGAHIHGNAIQAILAPSAWDVAVLPDPSRRYSEIYGDGAVGNRDCWFRGWGEEEGGRGREWGKTKNERRKKE